jgi:hypothetical protein
MPIFTIEASQDYQVIERWIAIPFHREGDELVNTERQKVRLRSDDPLVMLVMEPVTELPFGVLTANLQDVPPRAGDFVEFPPGSIRLGFNR